MFGGNRLKTVSFLVMLSTFGGKISVARYIIYLACSRRSEDRQRAEGKISRVLMEKGRNEREHFPG